MGSLIESFKPNPIPAWFIVVGNGYDEPSSNLV